MTKLEQKLIELGYEFQCETTFYKMYIKKFICGFKRIYTNKNNQIELIDILPINIECQQDIDNLQQAFNQLQQDLEVLKEYENAS